VDTNTNSSTFVPPYIAFRTLMDLVKRMAEEEPPSRIDKSYLHNYSGGYQTQVLAALTSLGLVDPAGTLSPELLALVAADEQGRKVKIGELVRTRYAPILAIGTSATQQMMIDAFTEMAPKVTGDTRRKAIAFFLSASNFAGIPVSRHWRTPRVPPSGKPRKVRDVLDDAIDEDEEVAQDTPTPNMKELSLRSGGVVTLGLSVDLFSLTGVDRAFVFELIDKMTDYENARMLSPAKVDSADNGGGVS
jgi:hypothetical protein